MIKRIVQSELLKFFSYSWSIFGVLGAVFVPVLVLYLNLQGKIATSIISSRLIMLYLNALYLGQAGIVIGMAGFIGQEYTHGALRTTFLANASRLKLLLVKQFVIIVTTLAAAVLSSSLCFGFIMLKTEGTEMLIAAMNGEYFSYVLPVWISWIFMGLIAGNLVVLTKSLIIPISSLFPMILGLSQMLLAITNLAKYLPDLAVMNLFQVENQKVFLDPEVGLATQCLWVLIICSTSIYCFKKRDVRC